MLLKLIKYGADDIKLTGNMSKKSVVFNSKEYDKEYEYIPPTKLEYAVGFCAITLWFYIILHGVVVPPPYGMCNGKYVKDKDK